MFCLVCFYVFTPPKKLRGENDIRSHFFPQQKFLGHVVKRRAIELNFHLVELVSVFFPSEKAPSWIYRSNSIPKQLSM